MGRLCGLVAVAGGLALGCAGPGAETRPPVDEGMVRISERGARAYRNGAWGEARVAYRQALERARALDDARWIGSLAYNLAAVELRMGRSTSGRRLLEESEAALRRAGLSTAPVELMEARRLRAGGDVEQAVRVLESITAGGGGWFVRAQLELASIAMGQQRLDDAAGHVSAARGAEALETEPELQIECLRAHARVDGARADHASQVEALLEALAHARALGHVELVAAVLAELAEAEGGAGNRAESAEWYYRAARSAGSQGDTRQALLWLKRGLDIMPPDGPDRTRRLMRDLHSALAEDVEQMRMMKKEEEP